MLKKIQTIILAVVLGFVAIIGSGCSEQSANYALPALIGVGAGVGSAFLINGMVMHNQNEMMKSQAEMQKNMQNNQAANQRCSGQDNLFAETWKACNAHPHSEACMQDQENLDKYCMPR